MEKIKKNWKSLVIFVLGGLFSAVPLSLVILFIELPKLENKIENSKKVEIKIAVSSVEKILDFFYNKELSGELSTDKAQQEAAKVIQNLRYSGNEYFWLHNLDLKMIMHPMKPELNGKDLSTIKDPQGKFLFVEMNKIITAFGSGYVDYLWPRPGEERPIPKSSFVSLFKPWGWILGSGVYVDNIQKEIQLTRAQSVSWLVIGSLLASVISILVGLRLLVRLVFPIQSSVVGLTSEASNLVNTVAVMSANSQSLKVASEKQSESLQETSAAMTQMNEMISKTATSAETSSEIADKTYELSRESLQCLNQLFTSMQKILQLEQRLKADLDKSLEQIQQMSEIMKSISLKTEVINDIVLQTKLLSFNASVEASRAGEFGKGFSVVAEEVGKLAQLSGSSAVEISEIVNSSQDKVLQISMTVKSLLEKTMEDIRMTVNLGMVDSKKSLDALGEVVNISTQSKLLAKQISQANKEQAIGSEEATKAIRYMEEVNQQLLAVVESNDKVTNSIEHATAILQGVSTDLNEVVAN